MPTANFNSPDVISCPNKTISFTNLSLGVGLTYRWHFGDGTTSTVQNPVHTYPSNGLYSVKLVVTNPGGCMDSITKPNFINIQTPVARFTASDTIGTCPPLIVNFTNNSLNYVSKLWDFGDGTSTSTNDPSHFYSIAGTYIAKLTVTSYGGCTSQMTQRIVVKGPSGTFTYGALSGCNPLNVQFRATTRGTDSYVWDFNDGYTNVTTDSVKSHIYSIAGAYIPKVILRDATGCIVPLTGRDTIHVYDLTTNFNFNAQAMCDEGTIQFNNTTATNDVITSYTWNFGDGSTSATGQANHHYTTSGTYYPQLIASTLHGCSDTVKSISPVKIVASPQAIITQTANGCVNLNVTFNGRLAVPDTSAISWEWNFGNGNTSTSINPTRQDYTTAGVYPIKLLIANSTGCKDTVLSSVEAYEIPTIEGGSDTMLCKGRGITLTATGGSTYQWSPSRGLSCTNCASPIANPDSALLYHVIGTSIHGCTNKDSINVRVRYPFNMTTSRGDTLCVGQSLRLTASGAYSYSWTPATGLDDANIASPTATPDVTTIYQVVSTDDRHCFTDTAKIPVVVYNIPTVEAGLDKTINVGQSIDLTPEISRDVIDAKWSPTGSIFRSNFPNISIKPRETTKYRVEVTNKGGCKSYDELIVNVLCDGANMFIPNTFSPNGDGMNDLFYPRGSGIFTIKRIKIFSRWGEVIFEKNNFQANDQSKAWDGTFKGSKLNPDVFVYVVEVVCDNNSVLTFKGNVALIK